MPDFAEGSIIGGRYRIERLLARGGMGSVWVAQHLRLGARVAVKLMDPSCASSSDARMRFEREATASAKLDSPHVVRVHDYGVEAVQPYLVMELLQGEDLGARLRRERVLSLGETATIVTQVCKALRCAHEAGLIHRDLKPANIFLAWQQDEVVVKVLDFGIAKSTTATEATKTGMVLGSPHYMSPEQARNSRQVDARSDLWSLGVVAFRCLTGKLPFPGEELTEVLLGICAGSMPVASQIAPHLGPDVDRFFERAMAREPAQRFQSPREFAAAMAALTERGPCIPSSEVLATRERSRTNEARAGVNTQHPATLSPTGRTLSSGHARPHMPAWVFVGCAVLLSLIVSALAVRWREPPRSAAEGPPSLNRETSAQAPAAAADHANASHAEAHTNPALPIDIADAGSDASPSAAAAAAPPAIGEKSEKPAKNQATPSTKRNSGSVWGF
ncbi:MAG: serine/threonine-protein kinase [Minicystis sp.]